jgi:glutamine amidotransferase-like uncharacterized protein
MSRSIPSDTHQPERPRVAIYHGQGVWPAGRAAIEHMLMAHNVAWLPIGADELHAGDFGYADVFWLPGGWSGDYEERITPQGMEHIRQFVRAGGRFVGICAGAFFASRLIVWEGEMFDYPAGLFAGQAVGPIAEIAAWPQCAMADVDLEPRHPINATLITPRQQLYYGGPVFVPDDAQAVDIVATYSTNGQPAAVTFQYGQGRVFLTGLHFETGPGCVWRDGEVESAAPALGADWEFGKALLNWLL